MLGEPARSVTELGGILMKVRDVIARIEAGG
jgi:hypothetical protein